MKNTDAEWVFITDADGSVQPSWIEHMLTGVDDSIGMIGGMVAVKDRSLLAIFERMSWLLPCLLPLVWQAMAESSSV